MFMNSARELSEFVHPTSSPSRGAAKIIGKSDLRSSHEGQHRF